MAAVNKRIAPTRRADSCAGGGRLSGHPPPGHSCPGAGSGARGGGGGGERRDRTATDSAVQSRRSHAGYRDAGDGRPGNVAASSARLSPTAGHHVQHAHRARRGGHSGSVDPGRRRLCDQGFQRRVARSLDGAPAGRADPEDQTVLPSAGTKPRRGAAGTGTGSRGAAALAEHASPAEHEGAAQSRGDRSLYRGADRAGRDPAAIAGRVPACRFWLCSTCRRSSRGCLPSVFTPLAGCQSKRRARARRWTPARS